MMDKYGVPQCNSTIGLSDLARETTDYVYKINGVICNGEGIPRKMTTQNLNHLFKSLHAKMNLFGWVIDIQFLNSSLGCFTGTNYELQCIEHCCLNLN